MKACAVIVGFNHWFGDTNFDKVFTRDFTLTLRDRNPNLKILLVDNFSAKPYPMDIPGVETIRLLRRVGYAVALNAGLQRLQANNYDWYLCFNNDCWIDPNKQAPQTHGRIEDILEQLDPCTLYGSGENVDKKGTVMQWSAWLCISREVFRRVGYFDEKLAAAFEDFDYELRAKAEGFKLDTAKFPIIHMDEHTRFEDKHYPMDWNKAAAYFSIKHDFEIDKWFHV